MAKGEHIYRRIGMPYPYHHGIDCGDGTVIHYDGNIVCRVSKHEFAQGEIIYIKQHGKCYPPKVVLKRAFSKLGERKYNPFINNCEHFANYCKTGEHKSEQIDQFVAPRAGIPGNVAVAVAGGAAVVNSIAAFVASAINVNNWNKEDKK